MHNHVQPPTAYPEVFLPVTFLVAAYRLKRQCLPPQQLNQEVEAWECHADDVAHEQLLRQGQASGHSWTSLTTYALGLADSVRGVKQYNK